MRAREFLTEQELQDVHSNLDILNLALQNGYIIPELSNSNFYQIYRFGVAVAAVRGEQGSEDRVQQKDRPKFKAVNLMGTHPSVSSPDRDVGKLIDKALAKVGKHGKIQISTENSQEMKDTYKTSPVKAFRGYK